MRNAFESTARTRRTALTIFSCAIFAVFLIAALAAHGQQAPGIAQRIVAAARKQIGVTKEYDPSYTVLKYPAGDVPLRTGVCSDVIVRALRGVGIDLQKELHEDMKRDFSAYPQKWGLKGPDSNIDHRRVANLMRFFERHQMAVTGKFDAPEMYRPGDIVTWDLGSGVLHTGIVSDKSGKRAPLVIHNIGAGAVEEDVLFQYHVIGHYRVNEGLANSGQPKPETQ
jgi:uncharacterized protein YijF (DUF1287 family)